MRISALAFAAATVVFVISSTAVDAQQGTEAAESRRTVESLSKQVESESRRAAVKEKQAAASVQVHRAKAEKARQASETTEDTVKARRLELTERVALLKVELAEALSREATNRVRALETELRAREYDLNWLDEQARIEQVLIDIEADSRLIAQVETDLETATARLADLSSRRRSIHLEIRRIKKEIKQHDLRIQQKKLALIRLDAQAADGNADLIGENRRLVENFVAAAERDQRNMAAILEPLERISETMKTEEEARRGFRVALTHALASLKFRAFFSPAAGRWLSRLFLAGISFLLLVGLLAATRRDLIPLEGTADLAAPFPFLVLSLAIILEATALSALLGYLELSRFVLVRGIGTLAALLITGRVLVQLSGKGGSTIAGDLGWITIRALAGAAGIAAIIAIWDVPVAAAIEIIREVGGSIARKTVRLTFLLAALLLIFLASRRIIIAIIKLAGRANGKETTDERTQRVETLVRVFRRTTVVIVSILGIFLVLREFNLDIMPLLAGAGIAGIAIGFGAQSLVRDFLNGFFILMENQYSVGDILKIGEHSGQVEELGLRTTVLRDIHGVTHIIPNGEITRVSNMTHEWSRALIEIGVGYGEDIDRVIAVLNQVGKEMFADAVFGAALLEPPQSTGVESFGDSSVVLRILAKTRPLKQWDVARELRRRIKYAFDKAGIEIPFPQVVIHDSRK